MDHRYHNTLCLIRRVWKKYTLPMYSVLFFTARALEEGEGKKEALIHTYNCKL